MPPGEEDGCQQESPSQHSSGSHASSSSGSSSRTFRPYGYGQVFPSFSPRSSGAGDTEFDWTMAEEKILRDVAQWLSPADLRRARLVCKTWYGALATLTTRASTPAETLVPQWKQHLEGMLQAFPCLQELTISSRLSSVAAQQLGVLATAKQLQVLNIPQAQALQDRSLLALQPLASHLRELRINGASSLSRRSLLLLSVLAHLQVLELKNCGKVSWLELQQAWRAACIAHEAQAAADAAASASGASTTHSSSGGGSSGSGARFSSSGGGFGSKLGAWLPTGRLFRTSSPSSNSIQSAVAWQRSGPTSSSLLSKVHDIARGTSSAAAVAVAQLGIGAVGNGRSSCGGSMPDAPARSLLHRKQKEGAAAAATSSSSSSLLLPHEETETAFVGEADALGFAGSGCFPVRSGLLRLRAKSATTTFAAVDEDSPRPVSMLARVGSLMWHSSSAASAGTGSGSSSTSTGSSGSSSFLGVSGSSLAAQASCVQAALQAYIAQEERAAAVSDAGGAELLPLAPSAVSSAVDAAARVRREAANRLEGSSSNLPSKAVAAAAAAAGLAQSCATGSSQQQSAHVLPTGDAQQQGGASGAAPPPPAASAGPPSSSQEPAPVSDRYKPRRRTTGDRALPAMPFTKLASLSFTCTEATLKSPGPELAAVAALSSLTALDISKCKLPDAVFVHLQGLSKLHKLKLSGLWSLGDAGLQHIAQLTTLKSLTLSEAMHVTPQGLNALSSLAGLTSLALGFTQDLGPGTLAHVVNSLPLLQCLEVAAPSWGDLDCEMLSAAAGAAGAVPQATARTPTAAAGASDGGAPGSGGGAPAGVAAATSGSTAPQMLWDLAQRSRSSSSRAISSRQLLLPQAGSRANSSSFTMRAPSFNRSPSVSFGSFSLNAGAASAASLASTAPAAQPPAALLPAQPLLKVLRLHGCRALTNKGMAALKQLPALHTLVLEDCKDVRAAEVISQGLLPPSLTSLTLRALPFGNLFSNCVSVPCCGTRLRKLELVSLEGAHEGQLRRLLSFFPNTVELSLAGCAELGDAGLQHVLLMSKLQQLCLSGCCALLGSGLEHLQQLQQLRVLSLRACSQLADPGLVGWLAGLPALEELDLSDCGGVSEQALLGVAQGCPRLVRLDVSGCRAVGRPLLAACPHYLHVKHSL